MAWVYDVELQGGPGGRWVPVRRDPQAGIPNQPIPDSDQSPGAQEARRSTSSPYDVPNQQGQQRAFVWTGWGEGPAVDMFGRQDSWTGTGISGITENTGDAKKQLLEGIRSGLIKVNSQLGAQIAGRVASELGQQLDPSLLGQWGSGTAAPPAAGSAVAAGPGTTAGAATAATAPLGSMAGPQPTGPLGPGSQTLFGPLVGTGDAALPGGLGLDWHRLFGEEMLKLIDQSGYMLDPRTGQPLRNPDGSPMLSLAAIKQAADLANQAYERAANPARAFENELARGANGQNGPYGGGEGGFYGGPYQPDQPPGGGFRDPMPFNGPDGRLISGDMGQPGQYTNWSDPAAQYRRMPGTGGVPEIGWGGPYQPTPAAPGGQPPQESMIGLPTGEHSPLAPAQKVGFQSSSSPDTLVAFGQGTSGGGFGGSFSQPRQAASGFGNTPVRVPAFISAFRQGAYVPSAGQLSQQSTTQPASQAALGVSAFQQQNLRNVANYNPDQQKILDSFGRAGGVSSDVQNYWKQRGMPGGGTASPTYAFS